MSDKIVGALIGLAIPTWFAAGLAGWVMLLMRVRHDHLPEAMVMLLVTPVTIALGPLTLIVAIVTA